jgi:hypothetical protein
MAKRFCDLLEPHLVSFSFVLFDQPSLLMVRAVPSDALQRGSSMLSGAAQAAAAPGH